MNMSIETAKVIANLWFDRKTHDTAHKATMALSQHKNFPTEISNYFSALQYLVDNGKETELHLLNRLCDDFVWDEEDRLNELLEKSAERQTIIRRDIAMLNSLPAPGLWLLGEGLVEDRDNRVKTLYKEYSELCRARARWFQDLNAVKNKKKANGFFYVTVESKHRIYWNTLNTFR